MAYSYGRSDRTAGVMGVRPPVRQPQALKETYVRRLLPHIHENW